MESLAELNERLAAIDAAEDARHVHGAPTSIGHNFAIEAPLLGPLPADDVELGTTLTPLVRRNSRIVVRQSYYSVPARFIGRKVRVSLRANEVLVFDGRQRVARHPRLSRRYEYHDVLDHYLEILRVKPGALAGSAALAQARAEGVFHAGARRVLGRRPHQAWGGGGNPGVDRGAAAAPPAASRGGGRWDHRHRHGWLVQPGTGRDRGPQGRRRTHPVHGRRRRAGRRTRRWRHRRGRR
ncbi:hypothetical protein WEI85_19030 [Actinomycetes bacterium KLBMP 9797]